MVCFVLIRSLYFYLILGNCFDGMFYCSETSTCISMELRCNGLSDCAVIDGSDEQECGRVKVFNINHSHWVA